MLDIDFVFLGNFDHAFHDEWMIASAMGEGRAVTEFDVAEFRGVDSRGVGGVGDIEANADLGFQAIRRHHRAVAADLFLDGIQTKQGDVGFFIGSGDAFHYLRDDVGAESVIERAGDEAFMCEFGGAVLIDHGVADAESHSCDFFPVGRADIDPEIVDGGCFFCTEFIAAEVDGGVADDSRNDSVIAEDVDAPAATRGSIGTANAIDAEEAFVIDVFDDVADLIRVGFEHDGFRGFAFKSRPSGAVSIALDLGGGFLKIFGPDILTRHFEACWGWSFKEFEEEGLVSFFHMRRVKGE